METNIRRLMQDRFGTLPEVREDSGCGVMTCANEPYFKGMQCLFESLQGRVPFVVCDVGMTDEQVSWCEERMPVVRTTQVMPKEVTGWQAYDKPFYIKSSPFRYTLFFDPDCVVADDLNPVFDIVRTRPLLVQHAFKEGYPGYNDPRLYDRFPVRRRAEPPQVINSGVVGFDREAPELLDKWCEFTVKATNDDVRSLTTWWDEGILHWAIQDLDCLDRILPYECGYNQFMGMFEERHPYLRTRSCAEAVRLMPKTPGVTVYHFTGPGKIWDNWQ